MNKRPFLLTTLTLFLSFDAASAQTSDLLEAGLESHLPAAAPRGWSIGNLRLDDHTEADKWDDHRPDSHAPIGVMGDHTHRAGEWMLSYRYMSMDMDGNRDGTSSLSTSDVFAEGFPIVPTEMTMEMHMFGGMYAPTDHLTLTAMIPYISMEMDHERPGVGDSFSTESDGLGDVRLGGLYKVYDEDRQRVHLNFAVSLPTGSTDEEDATPMGPDTKLPYSMQLGSGTWDLLPGVTYLGQSDSWSWGAQTIATFRLGENDEDYTLGDRLAASVWGARLWNDALSSSLRLGFDSWKNIRGRDEDLPMGGPAGFPAPTMDPDRRAGNRLDLGIGTNWYGREGWAKGHRLAIEVAFPLHQDLDGPQLKTDWALTIGWQKAF